MILLQGELGAGKTAFVRGLARGLGIDPADVTSPTFTLIQEYSAAGVVLQHVDLYRLEPQEVDDLGLDDLLSEAGSSRSSGPIAGAIARLGRSRCGSIMPAAIGGRSRLRAEAGSRGRLDPVGWRQQVTPRDSSALPS